MTQKKNSESQACVHVSKTSASENKIGTGDESAVSHLSCLRKSTSELLLMSLMNSS